jgi:hypothetical protein
LTGQESGKVEWTENPEDDRIADEAVGVIVMVAGIRAFGNTL